MRAWSTIVASRPCPMGNDCLYGKADAKGLKRLSNTNMTMTSTARQELLATT